MSQNSEKKFKFARAFAAWTVLVVAFLVGLHYAAVPVYTFPPAEPFKGDSLYNPYAPPTGKWYRANFHAHAKTWAGVTHGENAPNEIEAAYRRMGYDIVGVSNYQSIFRLGNADSGFIPEYEHGYGVMKNHHLVIGADRVSWLEYVLPQTVHQKQFVLNTLVRPDNVVAIAHPAFRDGWAPWELTKVTGYQCMEVASHYRRSFAHWDAALSAGRPVWILANDDSHDLNDTTETGLYWTMVHARSTRTEDVLAALRAGATYGVGGSRGVMMLALERAVVSKNMLTVSCTHASRFTFIGRWGDTLAVESGAREASYEFKPVDSYVRTVVEGAGNRLFLNPVVRYDGRELPHPEASIDWGKSILLWCAFLACYALIVVVTRRWQYR